MSVAVPFFNEASSIDAFFDRLVPILDGLPGRYEIVCVNDGSTDGTWKALCQRAEANPFIRAIDLSRNFGKEAALTAAIDHTSGDCVIPIDADLQDPPELITEMVRLWQEEDYEVVLASRRTRSSDTFSKKLTAQQFYRVFNCLADIRLPADTGDFRLMDRKVVDALKQLQERNRFMKGLFAWVGFRTTTVYFDREHRIAGKSSFNFIKLVRFAASGIAAFSSLPLRIWSFFGAVIAFAAFFYGSFMVLRTLISGIDVPGYASTVTIILFLGGVQLIGIGVLGAYLGKVYDEVKGRPVYLVREVRGEVEEEAMAPPGLPPKA